MVYDYNSNKEFINSSYKFLDKLKKEGVWNKDTLIIGLDKGVRPLAHTLKKISDIEKRSTPDFKFFNYSGYDNSRNLKQISEHFKERINPEKLSHYKKILVLDEHIFSGETLRNVKKIFEDYFKGMENQPEIHMAALGTYELQNFDLNVNKKDFIFLEGEDNVGMAYLVDTGIKDYKEPGNLITKSVRIKDKTISERFQMERRKLSRDIKKYIENVQEIDKKYGVEEEKKGSLEKITQTASLLFLVSGLIVGSSSITGNVVGSLNNLEPLGFVLIILGILGLFFSRKF